jgi:energy-coupling factor transporter ATP-binding protein EcfA2
LADDLAKIQRLARVAQAFTPGAPIDDLELFAGRIPQAQDVINAVVQKGQHVALYGERGVGKTSLANVLADFFDAPDLPEFRAAKVNCNTEDTFASLWRNIFRELQLGNGASDLSPEDVRFRLARLDPPALIVIDELDRLEDNLALTLLSDTVKALSDHLVLSTLVLVGVARSIGDLIGEHESIARALVKVQMPRMSLGELRETLENGCKRAGVTATDDAIGHITVLSRGLPHFTHLLGFHAGQRVVSDDRSEITITDVIASIPTAVDRHVTESDYLRATHSPHTDNLYPQVLLACALARQDQFGFFTAGAVRDPLEIIAGRRIEIPAFARHLTQFLTIERGSVLLREGSPRRYVYRFRDPILQTYVILNGIARGLISDDQMAKLEIGAPPTPDELIEPEQLF